MKIYLGIAGMSCNGCADNISNMIKDYKDVKKVNVNFENASAEIETNSNFNNSDFIKRFDETKFTISLLDENPMNNKNSFMTKIKNLFLS